MKLPFFISAISGLLMAAPAGAHPGHAGPHPEAGQPQAVVVEYSDFHCGPCAEVSELLEKLVSAKKVKLQVLFKHAPAHPEAIVAHEAALAAGKQGKFWEMHDLLFKNPKATYSEILAMAKALNLDVKRFQTALDEREHRVEVMTDVAEARGIGIRVTPTVFLNGRKLEGIEQIRSFVEMVINPPKDAPDPNKVYEFDLDGSPSTGPRDAPVTIVEFSDFRCGFCGAHSKAVSELVAAYPGKIRRVFKHFPIQVTAEGNLPHQGSMAAMAQGKFWEMYRALMNRPLTGRDDLISRAVAIGLDMKRFESDLAAAAGAAILKRDIEEGEKHGIRSTPTTFINGKMLSGRQTLESLRAHVDAILDPHTSNDRGRPVSPVATSLGPDDAPVLVEFFVDFANPDSAKIFGALAEFRKRRADVRIQFSNYPTGGSPSALQAHKTAMAAGAQGKLWEMSELIFDTQGPPNDLQLLAFASQLALDSERFVADLADHRHAKTIAADVEDGNKRGLKGKPALFFNGKRVDGVPTVQKLTSVMATCCSKRPPQFPSQPNSDGAVIDIFGSGGVP